MFEPLLTFVVSPSGTERPDGFRRADLGRATPSTTRYTPAPVVHAKRPVATRHMPARFGFRNGQNCPHLLVLRAGACAPFLPPQAVWCPSLALAKAPVWAPAGYVSPRLLTLHLLSMPAYFSRTGRVRQPPSQQRTTGSRLRSGSFRSRPGYTPGVACFRACWRRSNSGKIPDLFRG